MLVQTWFQWLYLTIAFTIKFDVIVFLKKNWHFLQIICGNVFIFSVIQGFAKGIQTGVEYCNNGHCICCNQDVPSGMFCKFLIF